MKPLPKVDDLWQPLDDDSKVHHVTEVTKRNAYGTVLGGKFRMKIMRFMKEMEPWEVKM